MRIRVLIAAMVVIIMSGCQTASTSEADAWRSTMGEQAVALDALRAEITKLREQMTEVENRPVIVHPGILATDQVRTTRRYALAFAESPGRPEMHLIYTMQRDSAKVVLMAFNSGNEKCEIVTGRMIDQDIKASLRRPLQPDSDTRAIMPPALHGQNGFVTLSAPGNSHVLMVLDDANERLLIYKPDINRKRLEVSHIEDLSKLFNMK